MRHKRTVSEIRAYIHAEQLTVLAYSEKAANVRWWQVWRTKELATALCKMARHSGRIEAAQWCLRGIEMERTNEPEK